MASWMRSSSLGSRTSHFRRGAMGLIRVVIAATSQRSDDRSGSNRAADGSGEDAEEGPSAGSGRAYRPQERLIVLMLMEAASTGPVYSTARARQTADRCGALQRFCAAATATQQAAVSPWSVRQPSPVTSTDSPTLTQPPALAVELPGSTAIASRFDSGPSRIPGTDARTRSRGRPSAAARGRVSRRRRVAVFSPATASSRMRGIVRPFVRTAPQTAAVNLVRRPRAGPAPSAEHPRSSSAPAARCRWRAARSAGRLQRSGDPSTRRPLHCCTAERHRLRCFASVASVISSG